MMRLAITVGLACGAALLAAPSARACSCVETPFEQLVASADAVFEGRVAAVEPDGEMRVRVRLDVVQTWRAADQEHVDVHTAAQSAACGVRFEVGRSYLVLARRDGDRLVASLCGGTRAMEDASDQRQALGSGVIPVDIEDEDDGPAERRPQTVAPRGGGCAGCGVASGGDASIAAGILGLCAMLRRRRRIR